MDDRPGIGIGVVHRDLFRRQLVAEDVIFDPGEAQRARGVEAGRLEIARDQFHRRDPALPDLGDERLAVGEGGLRPPQAEPHGIGEVVHLRRAGRRGVEHAGVGQVVLQENAGDALLRALLGAHRPFATRDAAHLMRLVERDDAVEVGTGPGDDLIEPGGVAAVGAQRRIGHEQDALVHRDGLVDLPARERLHIGRETAERGPVADRVGMERLVLADPDVLATTRQPVVEDDGRDLPPLPCPGAVAQEIALAVRASVVGEHQPHALLVWLAQARDILGPGMAGVNDGLELRGGQEAFGDGAFGQRRNMDGDRRGDRAHRDRFHQRGRMLAGSVEHDTARPIGQIDAGLLGEWRRRLEYLVADRENLVPGESAEDARGGSGLRSHAAQEGQPPAPLDRRRSGGLRDQILPGRDDQRLDQVAYGAALERDRRGITHRLVDDIESHRDSGAVLAIGMGQPDRGAQRDARQRRRPDRAHARGVEEPVGHDRDDAPARPHTLDRRLQVADRSERVGTAAERAREGRVHQDEAGALRGCHDAGDLRAVVAGNAGFREGGRQPLAARGIDLVELERRDRREARYQETVAGARFEYDVIRACVREHDRDRGEIERGRELLPVDLLLAAHGLGRKARHKPDRGVDRRRGACCAYRQRGRMLQHLEALALGPVTIGVGAAIGADHRVVEHRSGDLRVAGDRGEQQAGGSGGMVGARGRRVEQVGHGGLRVCGCSCSSRPRPPFPLRLRVSRRRPSRHNVRVAVSASASARAADRRPTPCVVRVGPRSHCPRRRSAW